jgi:hypothetical protein
MVQAYRDTWELGLHSYLTDMRNRLIVYRESLSMTGSVFVQISDETATQTIYLDRARLSHIAGAGAAGGAVAAAILASSAGDNWTEIRIIDVRDAVEPDAPAAVY